MSVQKQKNYKFSVKKLYTDEDLKLSGCYIKSVSRKNTLYIYIYEKGWLIKRETLLLSLKVTIRE